MENKKLYYYTGDLSIKSSAIIKWDKDFNVVDILYFSYKKGMIGIPYWTHVSLSDIGEKGFTEMYRWENFKYKFKKIMDFIEHPINFNVEASSYASDKGDVVDINQFTGGLITHIMMKFDIPINEYSPKTIKKFAGNGGAGKPQMRKFLKIKYPEMDAELLKFEQPPYKCIRFKPPIDDIVDSYWIGKLIEDEHKKGTLRK